MTAIAALFGVLLLLGFSAHTAAQDRSFNERNAIQDNEAAGRLQTVEQAHAIDPIHADDSERVVTSIVPSLDYGPSCWSSVTLTNLGDRVETVELEVAPM